MCRYASLSLCNFSFIIVDYYTFNEHHDMRCLVRHLMSPSILLVIALNIVCYAFNCVTYAYKRLIIAMYIGAQQTKR